MHQKKTKKKPITPLATVECFKQWYVIAVQQLRRTWKMFISFNIHFHVLCFCLSRVSLNNKKTRKEKTDKTNPTATTAMKTKRRFFRRQQWAAMSYWQQVATLGRVWYHGNLRGPGTPQRPTGTPRNDRLVLGGKLWHWWTPPVRFPLMYIYI